MEFRTSHQLFSEVCKSRQKWGIFIDFDVDDIDEVVKAAPWLDRDRDYANVLFVGFAYVICESEEECKRLFDMTVGDAGPTRLNAYNGDCRVYALTFDTQGRMRNENT